MKSQLTFLDSPDIDPETMTLILKYASWTPDQVRGFN